MTRQTLGILGGGQLGLMLAEAATPLGIDTIAWAPPGDNPVTQAATRTIEKPYDDEEAFDNFVNSVDAVTLEFENVPVSLLEKIEATGIPVRPGSGVLSIAQDRWKEKQFFERSDIPYAKTRPINQAAAYSGLNKKLDSHLSYSAILKTSRDGYDGKGQRLVRNNDELLHTWIGFGRRHCVLEEWIDFAFELSVIVARDVFGGIALYPPIVNEHRGHILRRSTCPSLLVTPSVELQAKEIARRIAERIGLTGILTVELFAVKDPETREYRLLANEIAPRPHNSGHGTIEACAVSQFEQLVRVALGQSVYPPGLRHSFVMENLIGEEVARLEGLTPDPKVFGHCYGKKEVRPDRKMGHITYLTD